MNSLQGPLTIELNSNTILSPFGSNGHPSAHPDAQSNAHHLPPPLLSADVDSVNTMTPMQISSASNMDNQPMDVSASSGRAPGPGLLPDFPPPNPAFSSSSDPTLSIMDAMRGSRSSPSTTSGVSSGGSHPSSPPINSGLSSAYSVGTSSLASALDEMGAGRTRSNSSASPVNLNNFLSDGTLSPESGLQFSQDSGTHQQDPQVPQKGLRVVDNMLQRVQQTVYSAREACSMGQRDEANMRIDELSRIVQAVADLIASAKIVDGPSTPPNGALGGPMTITSTAFFPPDYPPPGAESMEFEHSTLDTGDSSRKRCASSMANGERMIKAPKLEPTEDPLLHIAPLGSGPLQNMPGSFSFGTPQMSVALNLVDVKSCGSLPSSAPGSRPSSSSGILGMQMPSSANFIPAPLTLPSSPLVDMNGNPVIPPAPYTSPPISTGWSDTRDPFPTRAHHSHSLSGGSLHALSTLPLPEQSSIPYPMGNGFSPTIATHPQANLINPAMPPSLGGPSPSRQQHVNRPSRSSSLSNLYMTSSYPGGSARMSAPQSPIASSPEYDEMDESDGGEDYSHSPPLTMLIKNGTIKKGSGEGHGARPKASRRISTADANEIPQEFRADVDRIFFEFLDSTCSNLDATDAKGEAIHQTLMAKKMQRLDESPDFRPFKFRIQAFTNAFLEELAKQGLTDDKIPMKKIRNYLWSQPFISRFNEEGKKTKSKGNHIWHIDAKKTHEGRWQFRPFHRRLAGSPPSVAYIGLRWSWQPRVWDPQGARLNGAVRYSSPSLPPWLSWKDDILSGIPPADSQSCEVAVLAEFTLEGEDETLSQNIPITIAPMTAIDASMPSSRRPSLVGDPTNPRRVQSDTVLQQPAPPRLVRTQTTLPPGQAPLAAPDSQVIQVLNDAAERVSQAVQVEVVRTSRHPVENSPGLQALAKQQHVLSVSAQAVDNNSTHQMGSSQSSNVLMAAAQQVVYQAACQVATTNSITQPASTQLSVQDVSAATLSAVAQAVEIVGPLSSEVDVMMTASSLLQRQSRGNLDASQLSSHDFNSSSIPTRASAGIFAS